MNPKNKLRIFAWNVHGTFMSTLVKTGHDFYIPIKRGRPYNYDGKTRGYRWPRTARQISVPEIRKNKYDLIIFQTPQQVFEEQYKVLSAEQRKLPKIYIVHSPFKKDPRRRRDRKELVRHIVLDIIPQIDAFVHITRYNMKQWTTFFPETKKKSVVIYHGIEIPKNIRWTGMDARAVNVTNFLPGRPECGNALWFSMSKKIPMELYGMESEKYGGTGPVQNRLLRKKLARYRVYFNPTVASSVPMAMLEAMSVGLPVVSMKSTELPYIIKNGINGFISENRDILKNKLNLLLSNKKLAEKLGKNARKTIENKFSINEFIYKWNKLLGEIIKKKNI